MANLNKAMIIGNLGRDPEVRFTQGGTAVCNMTVAVNEKWKDKDGDLQEKTEWLRIVVFGRQAETCGEYLQKGRSVYVEGRIQTREWEDKDGQKRWTTEINADRVQFLGGGKSEDASPGGGYGGGYSGGGGGSGYGGAKPSAPASDPWGPSNSRQIDDSDIPF